MNGNAQLLKAFREKNFILLRMPTW